MSEQLSAHPEVDQPVMSTSAAPGIGQANKPLHIHILGICGTFMGSLAVLAKELGYQVSGSDANVYPPMSTQLEAAGIALSQGYRVEHLQPRPDLVIIGNALSRGNPAVEAVLDLGIPYISGPQWLAEHVLPERWVLAVSGTHGKTTTASMLAWILEHAGMAPGFLIGGVPRNFSQSARLGDTPFFVIEADEYDSAFFDKRSKFVHYRPRTLIMNNLEYDHADIFPDLEAIQRQFHHLLRTVPASGRLIFPAEDEALQRVLTMGCWSEQAATTMAADPQSGAVWRAEKLRADGSHFRVWHQGQDVGEVQWSLTGDHSVSNALNAVAAAHHVGVLPQQALLALAEFQTPKRRMEVLGTPGGVTVYDDFAHHPTAIATTLQGLRQRIGEAPLLVLIEPRSNTMRMGVHKASLPASVSTADAIYWYQPEGLDWQLDDVVAACPNAAYLLQDISALVERVAAEAAPGSHVVIMSNGGFGGVHGKLMLALQQRFAGQECE